MPLAAYDRFIASMDIGFDEWHDGIGYDLAALDQLEGAELKSVEALLIGRKDEDWRDTEALARIGSAKAVRALAQSTKGPNREVRLRAASSLAEAGHDADLDALIVEALTNGSLGDGLAQAEMLAEQHPTEAVKQALLRGALCSDDGRAVRFVGLLLYLHGQAPEAFDWSQRPYFLEFLTPDRATRRVLFDGLCARLGVDGAGIDCEAV